MFLGSFSDLHTEGQKAKDFQAHEESQHRKQDLQGGYSNGQEPWEKSSTSLVIREMLTKIMRYDFTLTRMAVIFSFKTVNNKRLSGECVISSVLSHHNKKFEATDQCYSPVLLLSFI